MSSHVVVLKVYSDSHANKLVMKTIFVLFQWLQPTLVVLAVSPVVEVRRELVGAGSSALTVRGSGDSGIRRRDALAGAITMLYKFRYWNQSFDIWMNTNMSVHTYVSLLE